MKIETNMIVFENVDNPDKELLPDNVQAMLGETYVGFSQSPILARLYSIKVESGATDDELNSFVYSFEGEVSTFVKAQALMGRFGVGVDETRNDFKSLFHALNELLDLNDVENLYYMVELYNMVHTKNATSSVGATVRHLYSLNRGRNEAGQISVEEIRKFILLNKSLRREGIVLTATEVFYCSLNWDTEEVFTLIEKGNSLSEALKMYDVGFKTVDEIIEYSDGIPMDWIDRILG